VSTARTYSCCETRAGDASWGAGGNGINQIVVDPTNAKTPLRRLGDGRGGSRHGDRQRRPGEAEPGANPVGLYESTAGGQNVSPRSGVYGKRQHFRCHWTSAWTRRIPRRLASAFDQCVGGDLHRSTARRLPRISAGLRAHPGGGVDETMFAATVNRTAKTRIY